MDEFGVFVLGSLLVIGLIFLAIGKWYPGSCAEQVDWRLTSLHELDAEQEMEDEEKLFEE